MEYKVLEPDFLSALADKAPSLGDASSLYDTSTFVYRIFFTAIIIAALYGYALAGIWRMQGTPESISKSNKKFKDVTWGLFGVFGLFLIIFTVNKQLLTGDVGFAELKTKLQSGGQVLTGGGAAQGSGGSSRSCESKDSTISKINNGGICAGTTCKVLSGCQYKQYESIIVNESKAQGVNPKMIIVTMCKESSGVVTANNKNPNGTFDCGLMQINQKTPCDQNILDPTTNIKKGVEIMKKKIEFATQIYPGIPAEAGAFASYNCCSNGTIPHAPSGDCTQAAGFPFTLPKWACPINPGEGQYNMCTVKNYTCELSACLNQL